MWTYTQIADYAIGQLWGFQQTNLLKNNVRYIVEQILGDPASNGDVIPSIDCDEYKKSGTTINFAFPPVGSIIAHYDFNAAVAIDTNFWTYCRGQSISDVTSPLNGLTLPDASNRILLGFGTEGGTDIHTATWSSTPSGNANHEVNLSHTHLVEIAWRESGGTWGFLDDDAISMPVVSCGVLNPQNVSVRYNTSSTIASSRTTVNTCTTSGSRYRSTSNSGGSSSQSIAMRSIKVRWIMRWK